LASGGHDGRPGGTKRVAKLVRVWTRVRDGRIQSPTALATVWPRGGRRDRTLIKQEGPGTVRFRGQTWGWELATLSSQSHTLGALAFAGRVLPDATLRGMRRFRSHGGTVPTVASRNLSSEASTPGSATACQRRSRQTGCRHACNLRRSRRHRYHRVGPGFWPGVSPMLRV
jgi:hypothetical protein